MTTHGKFGMPLYKLWNSVVMRCHSPTGAYFGRFTVCDEWRTFEPFEKWCLENNYETGLQIDRENNKLGYSPDNCRFVTRRVNCNNKDNNHPLTIFGETKTLTDWSRDPRCNVPRDALRYRIEIGWNPEEAITRKSGYRSVLLAFNGEVKSIKEWSEDPRCPVTATTLQLRIQRLKWPIDKAITTPSAVAA